MDGYLLMEPVGERFQPNNLKCRYLDVVYYHIMAVLFVSKDCIMSGVDRATRFLVHRIFIIDSSYRWGERTTPL